MGPRPEVESGAGIAELTQVARRLGGWGADLSRRQFGWGLVVTAGIGLTIRWWWILVVRPECGVDGRGGAGCLTILAGVNDPLFVHQQANLIADGHWYIDPFTWHSTGEAVASAHKMPAYSFVLSAVSWFGGTGVTTHRLASGVLGAGAVVLIGLAAARLVGRRGGLVAGLLAAVYPHLWVNDGLLQVESLFAGVAAAIIIAAYWMWDRPSLARAAALGALVGFATMTRAESGLLFAFLVLPLIVIIRAVDWRLRLRFLAAAWLVGGLVILPWVAWNLTRFQEPTLLSTAPGAVLNTASCDQTYYGAQIGYYGDCFDLEAVATDEGVAPDDVLAHLRETHDESERQAIANDQAVDYIRDHLGRLPVVMAARVGRMWDVFRPLQNAEFNWRLEARGKRASQLGLAAYYAMLPFAVLGGIELRRRSITLIPLLAGAAVITLTAAFTFGTTRYRVPADVALVVLAAVGVDRVLARLARPDDVPVRS